jgi:hypothetical protein
MPSDSSVSSGSMSIRQQIDACCQEFEQGWKKGNSPRM